MKVYQPNNTKITIPNHKPWKKILVLLILITAVAGGVVWWLNQSKQDQAQFQPEEVKQPAINGVMVPESLAQTRPVAAVIENAPEARPQSGLSDAEIVYETVAEGGITRFLALFQARTPKEIGPVRSARPYFNTLANTWGAAMLHSGGSKQALSELNAGVHKNVYDVNEFFFGTYFSRDKTRTAPHNLYTTREKISELLDAKGELNWEPVSMWQFETVPIDQLVPEVTNITIPFSYPLFQVKYTFDPTTNSYLRSLNNQPHTDRNNDLQISPSNIIILLTDITPTGDELLTMNVRLTGTGPCYLFTAGKFKECRWEYSSGKHVYSDTDGNPLKLQPGQIWVEIFPRDKQSELTWN